MKPGRTSVVRRVDGLRSGVFGFDLRARTDRNDRVAGDRDCAVVVDRARAVHGDDDAAGDQEVGGLLRLRCGEESWR